MLKVTLPIAFASVLLSSVAPAAESPPPITMTLSEAYQRALVRSESVRIAEELERDANKRLLGAWSHMGPQISITANGAEQTPTAFPGPTGTSFVVQPREFFAASAQISQPLLRGSLFGARRAGHRGVESAQASAARAREQLMIDVVGAFIGVLRSRQQIELAKTSLSRAETQLQLISARVKAGGGLRTAELQATLDVERSRLLLVNAQAEARNQEAGFETLVGVLPPQKLVLPKSPPVPDLARALDEANHRNDLRALQLQVRQSRDTESALRGRLWPLLDLQASYTYYTYLFPVGDNALIYRVGLSLTIPLFQGGDEYIQIRLQQARTELARLQSELLRKRITEAVKHAAVRLDSARATAEIAGQQTQTAQQNYNLVVAQFKLGGATFLEVTTAQAALTESENQQLVADFDRELSTYQFLFAEGQLKL